ncbi:MAG: aldo/keto reductase [Paracoccaceae bacterium]
MKRNRVGKTSVEVSEIAFGCASIGNLFREASDAESQNVLNCAWDAGINYFDTAPFYGRGLSETRLGTFLKGKNPEDFVISTKVGRLLTPGKPMREANGFINPLPNDVHYDYSGDGIEESVEQSCQRLGVNSLDIIFVHDLGKYTHGDDAELHTTAFLETGYEKLVKLKENGRIGAFGLGVNETQICLDVMDHGPLDVILLAGRLTLLDRSAEEQLTGRCAETGTSLVLGGIFNSGILATGPVKGATYDYGEAPQEILERVAQLEARALGLGIPLATAALQFALRHPASISVLLGTAKPSSLLRNLDALETTLPDDVDALFV